MQLRKVINKKHFTKMPRIRNTGGMVWYGMVWLVWWYARIYITYRGGGGGIQVP
jgi:hypothetical protein